MPRLVTAVIGAGPAGLLFCVVARLLAARNGRETPIFLFDKRVAYERTHRLRIGSEPWLAIQQDLQDPRFDAIISFLQSCRFTPSVNELEGHLSALCADLGVIRGQLEIGELTLAGLRVKLEGEGKLHPGDLLTIVGADSVHSAVREEVRGDVIGDVRTHQRVVRLRIDGTGLPERIGPVEQFRLSKLVDSLVDYRLNPNGFAEVDVFLSEDEHPRLAALGANPKEIVPLTDERLSVLRGAPLFSRIASHFREGFGAGRCEVSVYSTFRLEHRTMPRVVFERPEGWVFLVGDAAVSLPFFRGMACLAACAHALGRVHADLAAAEDPAPIARRYDDEVAAIVVSELAVVEKRARNVRLAREVARVSALLPFPIQAYLLSAPEAEIGGGGFTRGFVVNGAIALVAAAIALTAPILDAWVWEPLGWLWLLAVPVQILGGAAYYAARAIEPGPDTWVKRVWRAQILGLMGIGMTIVAVNSWHLQRPAQLHMVVSWWVLGIVFIGGLYAFERFRHRVWTSAALDA